MILLQELKERGDEKSLKRHLQIDSTCRTDEFGADVGA
jgi:hypothetical protein